jgi:hypothetical protein
MSARAQKNALSGSSPSPITSPTTTSSTITITLKDSTHPRGARWNAGPPPNGNRRPDPEPRNPNEPEPASGPEWNGPESE